MNERSFVLLLFLGFLEQKMVYVIFVTDFLLESTLRVGVFGIPFVHDEETVNAPALESRSKISVPSPLSTPSPDQARATVSALPLVPANNSGVSTASVHPSSPSSRYSSGLTLTSTSPVLWPGIEEVNVERRSPTSGLAIEASSGLQIIPRIILQTSSAPGGSRPR